MEVILVIDLNKLIKVTQNIQSKNMPSFLEFPGIKVLVARWAAVSSLHNDNNNKVVAIQSFVHHQSVSELFY